MEDEDERREAAIASIPSLQSNYKPSGVTQSQLAKFRLYSLRNVKTKILRDSFENGLSRYALVLDDHREFSQMRILDLFSKCGLGELHRRRLQVKAKSKIKDKVKGMSKKSGESCMKNLNTNDFTEGNSSKETVDSDVSVLKGKTVVKDTFSVENENVAVHVGAKKRQKLHWGLDTKERWERKANM